jgi:hypothetical protein
MIKYIIEEFNALSSIAVDIGKDVGLDVGKGIGKDIAIDIGKGVGKDIGLDVGKGIGKDIGLDVGKGIGKDVGLDVGKGIGKDVGLDVGKDVSKVAATDAGKDAVVDAVKNSPEALVKESKSILSQAGDAAVDFAKKNPMLAAAGFTASGVAIYAAANHISFAEATGQLTNSVGTNVIKPIAESVGTLAGSVVSVGVNDVAGPILAPIWNSAKEIFSAFKTPLIIIGVILVLIIIYKIYNFINN